MNVIQLRPKYSIEQYPIILTFPGIVSSYPGVTVDIISGDTAPAKIFVGLPSVDRDKVLLSVSGGLPGAVYKISCTGMIEGDPVVVSGILAVLPTVAQAPPGNSILPFTDTLTSHPYSTYNVDDITVSSYALSGEQKLFLVSYEYLETLQVSSHAVDGEIRPALREYSYTETIEVSSIAVDGIKRVTVLPYDYTEDVQVNSIAIDGIKRITVIDYLNYPPENIEVTSHALDGIKL